MGTLGGEPTFKRAGTNACTAGHCRMCSNLSWADGLSQNWQLAPICCWYRLRVCHPFKCNQMFAKCTLGGTCWPSHLRFCTAAEAKPEIFLLFNRCGLHHRTLYRSSKRLCTDPYGCRKMKIQTYAAWDNPIGTDCWTVAYPSICSHFAWYSVRVYCAMQGKPLLSVYIFWLLMCLCCEPLRM